MPDVLSQQLWADGPPGRPPTSACASASRTRRRTQAAEAAATSSGVQRCRIERRGASQRPSARGAGDSLRYLLDEPGAAVAPFRRRGSFSKAAPVLGRCG